MGVREDIQAVLVADPTLMSVLTGGVYAGGEISRQATPLAWDANEEILPCALVRVEAEGPWGPFERVSRGFVVVFFYERSGQTNIDAAVERVHDLLHRQKALSGRWEVLHVNDLTDQEDQALVCSLALSRYQVLRNREIGT